jgi:hypothetical protein
LVGVIFPGMKNRLLLLTIVLSMGVCAGGQETGTVHFYRYKQYMGSALRPSVYCDDLRVGRIENGRYLDVKVPAGAHTFYAEDKQAGAIVMIETGKEYFFRTDLQTGFWKGHFRLTIVMPEQGKFDLPKLKPSESAENIQEVPQKTAEKQP